MLRNILLGLLLTTSSAFADMTWYFEAKGVNENSGLPAILEGHFVTEGNPVDLEGTGTTTFKGERVSRLWLNGIDILPLEELRWAGIGIIWDRNSQSVVHPTDPFDKTVRAESRDLSYLLVVDVNPNGATFATFGNINSSSGRREVRMLAPSIVVRPVRPVRPIPDTPLAAVPALALIALCVAGRFTGINTRDFPRKS